MVMRLLHESARRVMDWGAARRKAARWRQQLQSIESGALLCHPTFRIVLTRYNMSSGGSRTLPKSFLLTAHVGAQNACARPQTCSVATTRNEHARFTSFARVCHVHGIWHATLLKSQPRGVPQTRQHVSEARGISPLHFSQCACRKLPGCPDRG